MYLIVRHFRILYFQFSHRLHIFTLRPVSRRACFERKLRCFRHRRLTTYFHRDTSNASDCCNSRHKGENNYFSCSLNTINQLDVVRRYAKQEKKFQDCIYYLRIDMKNFSVLSINLTVHNFRFLELGHSLSVPTSKAALAHSRSFAGAK